MAEETRPCSVEPGEGAQHIAAVEAEGHGEPAGVPDADDARATGATEGTGHQGESDAAQSEPTVVIGEDVIDVTPDPHDDVVGGEEQPQSSTSGGYVPPRSTYEQDGTVFDGAATSASDVWNAVEAWFKANKNTVIWAGTGLVVAILMLVFGFWHMLLIIVLVTLGAAYGQYLDGRPRIIDFLRHLFGRERR